MVTIEEFVIGIMEKIKILRDNNKLLENIADELLSIESGWNELLNKLEKDSKYFEKCLKFKRNFKAFMNSLKFKLKSNYQSSESQISKSKLIE